MAISLYDASVANYLQILDGVSGFMAKGRAHFEGNGTNLDSIVETRLIEDMRPFRFQVQHVAFHSAGAVDAILKGVLNLPGQRPELDYAGLQALIDDTRAHLRAVSPDAVNAREDEEVVFQVGDNRRVFTAPGFLFSFSMPNFYFHATTAYDILRSKGAPIGKFDYMSQLRLKEA